MDSSRTFRRPALAVGALVALIGALTTTMLTACSPISPPGEFRVVTSTTQVSDLTRNVVGETGRVYTLLQANQSAHTFDPSARDLLELNRADAFVINGDDLEPWLTDAIAASGFHGQLIVASDGVTPITRNGVTDPHVWTDPANAERMTTTIAKGLTHANPADASVYESNATTYVRKLATLDDWIRATLDQVPPAERLLVTNHDAFTYFVDAYGITLVGSIIPEFDDNAEPSAADIDELVNKIRTAGAKAIFAESSISPKLAKTVATETGILVFSGPDSLYSDTLGAPGSGAETYISSTIHNVTQLARSWGVTPVPLPKEIANA